jgi:hypothetical protein
LKTTASQLKDLLDKHLLDAGRIRGLADWRERIAA